MIIRSLQTSSRRASDCKSAGKKQNNPSEFTWQKHTAREQDSEWKEHAQDFHCIAVKNLCQAFVDAPWQNSTMPLWLKSVQCVKISSNRSFLQKKKVPPCQSGQRRLASVNITKHSNAPLISARSPSTGKMDHEWKRTGRRPRLVGVKILRSPYVTSFSAQHTGKYHFSEHHTLISPVREASPINRKLGIEPFFFFKKKRKRKDRLQHAREILGMNEWLGNVSPEFLPGKPRRRPVPHLWQRMRLSFIDYPRIGPISELWNSQ